MTLDLWQRQAVLAAASLLRERFGTSNDARAKAVHDALLEVVEPKRRALRLQRDGSTAVEAPTRTARSERRARPRDRRTGWERRVLDVGSPTGVERRAADRRGKSDRRSRK